MEGGRPHRRGGGGGDSATGCVFVLDECCEVGNVVEGNGVCVDVEAVVAVNVFDGEADRDDDDDVVVASGAAGDEGQSGFDVFNDGITV